MKMRGVEVAEFGGPDVLTFREDLDRPSVGAHEVLVQNHFAGVNFKDLILCRGDYHGGNPDLPFIPGIEAAGVIAAVGADVTTFEVGQRVVYMTGSMASQHNQCYAEYNVISAAGSIQVIPDDISFETACALVIQGLTMHYLLDMLAVRQPRSMSVCTLLDKPANREVEMSADYVGFSIPDEFVVGYGLDLAERYRNLPHIAVYTP